MTAIKLTQLLGFTRFTLVCSTTLATCLINWQCGETLTCPRVIPLRSAYSGCGHVPSVPPIVELDLLHAVEAMPKHAGEE